MATINSNNPNLLNAFKMGIKNIGGKLYRVNNLIANNLEKGGLEGMTNLNDINNDNPNVKNFKLVNIAKKMSRVISDDDATSEEEISNNISFADDDDEEGGGNSFNRSASMSVDDIEDFEIADVDSYSLFASQDSNKNNIPLMKGTKGGSTSGPKGKVIKWTHFLSIPFHMNSEFMEKYEYFKKKIMEENLADVDENLFQKPHRLHMTICLFRLEDKKSIDLVEQLIKECEEQVKKLLDGNPLHVDFDQLEIMGNPNKTRVLYTRPHNINSEKFRDVIDTYLSKFIESNLISEDMRSLSHIYFNEITERYENEKAHVTLMNSTYVLRQGIKSNINSTNIMTRQDSQISEKAFFNGMKIIKRMKNFSFGVHKIDQLVLNEMRIDKSTDSYHIVNKYKINH
jgi:hypothetical protein